MIPTTALLNIQGLTFHRDWQVILHDVNLEVGTAKWLVLRGGNGCGKTTLLKLCVGLLTPTTGTLTLSGTYSYLGHLNGIKPTQTLAGMIQSLPPNGQTSAKNLAESLGMTAYFDVPFHQLSAGLKRRIALVQFLTPKVNIYIVDEPLDNLDPASCHLVWQLLAEKVNHGAAILMAHHGSLPFQHPAIQEVFLDV
ncbi:ABC transporter ATP-binding protein [Candidatus Paracaedibacter symbiosus]|uniref:ABC transporter ATP-binding protein n=1 Tax=Candidatus Paracaedibacter symbiosus TaxID=244582 RepID=UPI00050964D6|nr:ATP-binding cassette domain-containing protein [Candidatus Paracaedibacter symbiosus]